MPPETKRNTHPAHEQLSEKSEKPEVNGEIPPAGVWSLRRFAEELGWTERTLRDKFIANNVPVADFGDGRVLASLRRFEDHIYQISQPLKV